MSRRSKSKSVRSRSTRSSKKQQEERLIKEDKEEVEKTYNYEFVKQEYSIHLKCPFCLSLMRNPHRLNPCGDTFCWRCTQVTKTKCPQCARKVTDIQKDLIAQGMIDDMEVKCKNKDCPYKGKLNDYKANHHKICKMNGMEDWMNNMKSSLNQNIVRRKFSSDNEEIPQENQEEESPRVDDPPIKNQIQKVEEKPSPKQVSQHTVVMNWQNQLDKFLLKKL